ncbi:hypothetical protein Hanom_Chr16g01504681 [Helianthus anomalus]
MPDDQNCPNQVRNKFLTQCAPEGPSVPNQPHLMLQNAYVGPSNASTSTFDIKDEELVSKNRMLEPLEKFEDKHCMPKLKITLTREEIEEDYFGMTGRKLPRNMMKRDKTVQKGLDVSFL